LAALTEVYAAYDENYAASLSVFASLTAKLSINSLLLATEIPSGGSQTWRSAVRTSDFATPGMKFAAPTAVYAAQSSVYASPSPVLASDW